MQNSPTHTIWILDFGAICVAEPVLQEGSQCGLGVSPSRASGVFPHLVSGVEVPSVVASGVVRLKNVPHANENRYIYGDFFC
ncbi:MAG: hypothetical protein HC773_25835 [Scytonema sp. CRU_2_7]|nr:hypothetical protein [Scytonema sp. CRU_2_7]